MRKYPKHILETTSGFLKKGFHKAKIVFWNVQFPILCTHETIFKSFYYLLLHSLTCIFPNAFLWKWSLVPTDKEDQGRDGKMISLLAAPSSRLIGMLRIGIDGLILFMEPTSFETPCKDRYTAYVTEIDLFDAQYKDNDLSNIWPSHHLGMWEGVPCQGEGGYSKMVNEEDQHQLWSLTFEKISKTYSGTYLHSRSTSMSTRLSCVQSIGNWTFQSTILASQKPFFISKTLK